jgi:hypothetical protein
MNETGYRRIVDALETGRRALARARLMVGLLRFAGVALATVAGLVVGAAVQRALAIHSVPFAAGLSILGAGLIVFAIVRWIVVPLLRMPGRDAFVAMIERRYPEEKNLIVNAYQLGDADRPSQAGSAPDLVEVVVSKAEKRIGGMDVRKWRDPAPDRPFLWAGAAAVIVVGLLAAISPQQLAGAWTQVIRPSEARPPEVVLQVSPGDLEVDRGSDVPIRVAVTGTDKPPLLQFRERHGTWRKRNFAPADPEGAPGSPAAWETVLPDVDRALEYRVEAPRAQSDLFTINVREVPRLSGFRALMDYPDYTGLPTETLTSGTGDLTALKGTKVDLRILTNRPLAGGYLDWRTDGAAEDTRLDLAPVDPTTMKTDITLGKPASYAVVLLDEDGSERLRSPRYRVDPAADRYPLLTLHYPQDDHDLSEDMMERIVADAADDYGFHSVRVKYRVDDGDEKSVPFAPFTAGQTEFRLDTLWDLSGLDLLPGNVITYYVEVRDNDTVSGPKAVRSPLRRVRFPTLGEMYEDVAEDHSKEIDTLTGVQEQQKDLRKRLEKLTDDLKKGREMNWDLRQDVQRSLEQQQALESQISQVTERLKETLSKAGSRAQMNQDLLQKMSQINDLLQSLGDEELKRNFRELSRALDRMDRNAIRRALENMQANQDQMLRGMDRTIELLKQIRREEQVEDLVRRTDEIARLQAQIAEEMEKLRGKQKGEPEASAAETAEKTGERNDRTQDTEMASPLDEGADPNALRDGSEETAEMQGDQAENADGESQPGDMSQAGEQSGEEAGDQENAENRENADSQAGDQEQGEKASADEQSADQQSAENQSGEQQSGDQQKGDQQGEQKNGDQQGQAPGEQQNESNSQEQGSQSGSQQSQQKLAQLAQEQKKAEEMVEELKRLLKALRKLNEDQANLKDQLENMENSETLSSLQQNQQSAQQSMSGGKPDQAANYAFRARDEANRLAGMAEEMQSMMAQNQQEDTTARMEAIIKGLIDISGVQEELATSPAEDPRLLAQRQFDLTERTEAWADSLQVVMQQSFSLTAQNQDQLDVAIGRMGRVTDLFEQSIRTKAEHEARESTSDLNETIVELMKSHQQMMSSQGQCSNGDTQGKMQGLSQGQRSLNQSTRELLERLASKERLSMTDEQRLAQLAAQQEMIRQGLQEVTQNLDQAEELLGDMNELSKDMESVGKDLRDHKVDPRILERQQQILSRLLDAQRSVRQQEMSPDRESRTGTLASRTSPPPIPESLLQSQRTLEEDMLRGANDHYPSQYRKLVEDYFRALSREDRAP